VTSEGNQGLTLTNLRRQGVPKEREPKDKLCRGIACNWLVEERVDTEDLRYCRRSEATAMAVVC